MQVQDSTRLQVQHLGWQISQEKCFVWMHFGETTNLAKYYIKTHLYNGHKRTQQTYSSKLARTLTLMNQGKGVRCDSWKLSEFNQRLIGIVLAIHNQIHWSTKE